MGKTIRRKPYQEKGEIKNRKRKIREKEADKEIRKFKEKRRVK